MTWTPQQLEEIPEVYRDFMVVLKPVVDSRAPGVLLKITGIPFRMFVNVLSSRHDYDAEQVWQVAQRLKQQGLVDVDRWGFYTPTGKGEALIQALAGSGEAAPRPVPPLPQL